MKQVALAVALVAGVFVAPAHAVEDNSQSHQRLDNHGISVGITYEGPAGERVGSVPRGRAVPVVTRTVQHVFTANSTQPGDLSGLCLANAATNELGWWYRIVTTTLSGQLVSDAVVCEPFPQPGADPQPPSLPAPPTIAEVWNRAAIPTPQIVIDPPTRGITGLDTTISVHTADTVSIDATVRGYRIVGTATLDHTTLTVDGVTQRTAAAIDATTDDYVFETKGVHRITGAAVWRGTAQLTGPGLPAAVHLGDIGTATITVTRAYDVHEVRAVLAR